MQVQFSLIMFVWRLKTFCNLHDTKTRRKDIDKKRERERERKGERERERERERQGCMYL